MKIKVILATAVALFMSSSAFAIQRYYNIPVFEHAILGESEILAKVATQYKGYQPIEQTLSVVPYPHGDFQNCSNVHVLLINGEYLTIRVGCSYSFGFSDD